MAVKIPTYDDQLTPNTGGVRYQSRAVEQTPVLGQAVQRFGDMAGAVSMAMLKDANEGAVREADNQASDTIRKLLYDSENGYLAKTGKEAKDGFKDIETQLRGLSSTITGTLQTGAQQQMFKQVIDRRIDSALNSATVHAAQQTKAYNVQQAAARAANAAEDAVLVWNDPKQFATNKATMVTEATFGLNGAAADLAAREALSKLHTNVIQLQIAQHMPDKAREWFEANKGEISASTHDDIVKLLDGANTRQQSLNTFLDYQSLYPTYKEQEAALKKDYQAGHVSAEVYDETLQRLDHADARRRTDEAQANQQMEGQAQEWLLRNPGSSVLDMPPNLFAWAKREGRLDSLKSFSNNGGQGSNNPSLHTQWVFKFSDDPIGAAKEFRNQSEALRTQMSASEYNSLLAAAAAATKNDFKQQDAVTVAATVAKSIGKDLYAAGLTNKRPEQLAEFQSVLIQEIQARTAQKGQALTNEEARKVGLDLLRTGKLQGSGAMWDTKKRRYEVTAEEQAQTPFVSVDYNDIPADKKAKLYDWMNDNVNGKPRYLQFGLRRDPYGGVDQSSSEYRSAIERLYQQAIDAGAK